MVTQMTNRLLATVMAFAVSTGLVAHTAGDAHHRLPALQLPKVSAAALSAKQASAVASRPKAPTAPASTAAPQSLPLAVQTAANHLSDTATAVVDPSAAVRGAFQRDQLALEHLRQLGAGLKGTARQAFNQRISESELALVEMEKTALASKSRPASTIASMDQLVALMRASLQRGLSQSGEQRSGDQSHQSHD